MGAHRWWALVLAAAFSVGCGGPPADLAKGLQLLDVSSGWADVGIVDGQNKLVPSLSFTVKNVSDRSLSVLQVNVLFRRVTEKEEWGSAFFAVSGSEGLASGETSKVLTARCQQGYKGVEPRADMLKNAYFVDAKAEVFAKYGSVQWQKLGDFPIARQLVTQ